MNNLDKIAKKVKRLDDSLNEAREKIASLKETNQRKKTAEDISLMLASSGSIEFEEVVDHRDKLASSSKDLDQMKTALKTYGPGRVDLESVEEAAESSTTSTKSASLFELEGSDLPQDVKQAEKDIQQILSM